MRKLLTFLTILTAAVAVIVLFTACEQFLKDPEDFLSYWASEAFIKDHSIGAVARPDEAGVPCVSSSDEVHIMLTVHNPKGFSFVLPTASEPAGIVQFKELSPQPTLGTHYDLGRTSSGRLKLTYKEAFLQEYEQGSGSLNPTITLKATDGRVFKKTYTFGIKSNTPPPKPAVVLAKTTGPDPHYVLCLKFDSAEMINTVAMNSGSAPIHKDIAEITINDAHYALSYKDDNSDFKKPAETSFIERGNVQQLTAALPSASEKWVLYYKTDIQIGPGNPETSYTVTLIDKEGVTSDEAVKTIEASGPTHTVTFSVENPTGGTLKAEVDGTEIHSGEDVEKGKTVTFTATPNTGWEVEGWTFNGSAANGTNTSASLIVNEPKIVTVKFKQNTHTVRFEVAGGEGSLLGRILDTGATLTATTSPKFFYNVPSGKQVEFTALPENDWKVEKWTVSSDGFESGGGTGETNATLKVTGDTTVTVKFYRSSISVPSTWKALLFAVKNAPQNGTIIIKGSGAIKATNAADDHGEIVIDKNLTILGNSLSVYLDADGLSRIFKVKAGKTLTLEKIKLKNGKENEGGGVYNEGTLIMKEDSFIGGCEAGKGGGVYNNGTLIMEKDSWVTPSAGIEQYTAGKNDVYLKNGKMITVKGLWTDSPVARITLEDYRKGVEVLTGNSSIVSANHKRFTVTPDSETGMPWYIDADGTLNIDEVEVKNESELEAAINGATPGRPRLIKVTSSFASTKSFIIASGKIITIKAAPGITLTCNKVTTDHHKHFHVKSGKLTFSGNITLQGDNYGHTQYALYVEGGTAEIKDNVTITGFSMNMNGHTFAGVYINATVIMSGGTIKNGKAKHGGGVYIERLGVFTMEGGTITGNTANHHGRALWIRGTFNWNGGTITGNSGSGDVLYIDGGTFSNNTSNTAS